MKNLIIPDFELSFSYARSSGPGGQKVNKTSSKAILHWNLDRSTFVPDAVKIRFMSMFGRRINSDGDVVIHSEEHRDRSMNELACIEKLKEMLLKVWTAPKKRVATKPTKSSQRRRVEDKRKRSIAKSGRKIQNDD